MKNNHSEEQLMMGQFMGSVRTTLENLESSMQTLTEYTKANSEKISVNRDRILQAEEGQKSLKKAITKTNEKLESIDDHVLEQKNMNLVSGTKNKMRVVFYGAILTITQSVVIGLTIHFLTK